MKNFASRVVYDYSFGRMVQALAGVVKSAAQTLPAIDDPDFGKCFDCFGGSRIVLIGDSR
jgi:hypothetical protein